MNKQQIFQILSDNSEELAAMGVRRIGLYGLFADGGESSYAMVDMLVELQREERTIDNFMALVSRLENILGHKVNLTPVTPRHKVTIPMLRIDHIFYDAGS